MEQLALFAVLYQPPLPCILYDGHAADHHPLSPWLLCPVLPAGGCDALSHHQKDCNYPVHEYLSGSGCSPFSYDWYWWPRK